jgi:hypothetical protein
MNKWICRALACGAILLLAGCARYYSHNIGDVVHDNDLTEDDYDGTVSFGGEGMTPAAPPVEVHEFDPEVVQGAGGVKLIDGKTWLDASDGERNQLLLDAEKTLPSDAILVLVVATGEVWTLGTHADDLIGSGAVVEWSGADYDNLYEYYFVPPTPPVITQADFTAQTVVELKEDLVPLAVIHDLGPIGRKEMQSAHGFEVIAPYRWNAMNGIQRGLELEALYHFNQHLPAFQGPGNQPAFAVSVSWGMVYAAPQRNLDQLISYNGVSRWNAEQIGNLPYVQPYTDRPIRTVPLTISLDTKF